MKRFELNLLLSLLLFMYMYNREI